MNKKDLIVPRVGVVVKKGDNILLVEHTTKDSRYWVLPGGGIEFEETVPDCAERETLEETNITVKFTKLLFVSDFIPKDGKTHVVNIIVEANYISGDVSTGQDPDHTEQCIINAKWMPLSDLNSIQLYPEYLRDRLQKDIVNSEFVKTS